MLGFVLNGDYNLLSACNGLLGGLVAVTAGCSVMEPWAAIICGAVAAPIFTFAERFVLHTLKIDDPVSAVAMHYFCGAWGVLFPGLLAREKYVAEAYGTTGNAGIFYGGNGKILACQLCEIAVLSAWVMGLMGVFFFVLKTFGVLRVPHEVEMAGLDVSKHGGSAYYNEEAAQVEPSKHT
jgi:ammonium transporter, Amt family